MIASGSLPSSLADLPGRFCDSHVKNRISKVWAGLVFPVSAEDQSRLMYEASRPFYQAKWPECEVLVHPRL